MAMSRSQPKIVGQNSTLALRLGSEGAPQRSAIYPPSPLHGGRGNRITDSLGRDNGIGGDSIGATRAWQTWPYHVMGRRLGRTGAPMDEQVSKRGEGECGGHGCHGGHGGRHPGRWSDEFLQGACCHGRWRLQQHWWWCRPSHSWNVRGCPSSSLNWSDDNLAKFQRELSFQRPTSGSVVQCLITC